ncbi:hypothetical protein BAUCODRAFT_68205 [Baudoinia panamericana UAMH 10762]|uniref:Uncharacterized protein n=1 Tax=Baudoinia panamericana (strain UAMH 10762) TaxID=717646 RepID=M2NEE0_BAUPA|nr:uncharacterized protein BAUCODRAFT_68205 [Baudoinia panamericana UAMH 10762]EMC97594.1 hypothetical protein BAUCODRAFT_68205 [Baudoinia panamericana UAMH 10762]
MASSASLGTLRTSILRLPPAIRAAAYRASLARSFSASTTRRFSVVDVCVAPPTFLLDSLHSLGLPWYAVIPTTAFAVRGLLLYYYVGRPNQKAAQVYSYLQPLVAARFAHRRETPEEKQKWRDWDPPLDRFRPVLYAINTSWWRSSETRRIAKQFNAAPSRLKGLLNFGVLIAMTESLRMKSGSREGLLPLLVNSVQWSREFDSLDMTFQPTLSQDEQLAARLEQARVVDEQGSITYDMTKLAPAPDPEPAYAAYLDPSLHTEGLPWCPDLAMPDPTGILPAAMVAIMEGVPVTKGAPARPLLNRFQNLFPPLTRWQRVYLLVACAFGWLVQQWPAALLLYFISNIAIAAVQQQFLRAHYPVRRPIRPCARPLRQKVRKAWS